MKKVLLGVFIFLLAFQLSAQTDLYIAGVIDGPLSGGTPKAIQFCVTADIPDLSIYGFGSANNGGGTDGEEYTFPAEIANTGTCFWVNSSGVFTNFNTWFGFNPCYSSGAASINGDDAIELFRNGTVVDLFGDINVDGTGECWDHIDGWAKANDAVASTVFNCVDWTFSGTNALDGESTNATATTPYPSPGPQTCPLAPTMPITLSSFQATPMDNKSVQIKWATASEENNEYFSLEHSTDGVNFREVNTQAGAGTSTETNTYIYTHKDVANGLHYYRLLQVDYDGAFEYSDIVTAEVRGDKGTVFVMPNPASNDILIQTKVPFTKDADFQILNMHGQVVLTNVLRKGATELELNISDFPIGIYYLQLFAGNEVIMKKIIKQ